MHLEIHDKGSRVNIEELTLDGRKLIIDDAKCLIETLKEMED